jgi:hypothetical protein
MVPFQSEQIAPPGQGCALLLRVLKCKPLRRRKNRTGFRSYSSYCRFLVTPTSLGVSATPQLLWTRLNIKPSPPSIGSLGLTGCRGESRESSASIHADGIGRPRNSPSWKRVIFPPGNVDKKCPQKWSSGPRRPHGVYMKQACKALEGRFDFRGNRVSHFGGKRSRCYLCHFAPPACANWRPL